MHRSIIHVDMDAFYASVEQRENPALLGKPVIVGGISKRGVVSTASYEARVFGVHSAMPIMHAKRLCPQGIYLPGRHALYREVSRSIFSIFHKYTPLVEGLSLDEAFLDVTASIKAMGAAKIIAQKIKDDIFQKEQLTASAGVASNKFIAKIASDLEKPNGLTIIAPSQNVSFLQNLPIEKMWGLGKKTSSKLRSLGIQTFGDLASVDPQTLLPVLGKRTYQIQKLARGEDDREVISKRDAKSVGSEQTFSEDLVDTSTLLQAVLNQTVIVSRRLHKEGYLGKSIGIKVKFSDFQQITRQTTVSEPVSDSFSIFEILQPIAKKITLKKGVRLVGVFVTGLVRSSQNLNLFSEPAEQQRKNTDEAVGKLLDKYGSHAVTRASLLYGSDEVRKKKP